MAAGRAAEPEGTTLTSCTTCVTRPCEKSRAITSCGSQLTRASATGATSKILRGRMFMGAFIVCAPAFVKSFLQAFLPSFDTADYTDNTDGGPSTAAV